MMKSARELMELIPAGQRIFVQGAAGTPCDLLEELARQHQRLAGTEVMHLHTHGPAPHARVPEFRVTNLFVGENMRSRIDQERIDYLPCFLSEIPLLFRRRIRAPDVALIQVSPPDAHGFCSLGTSVDVARAAVDTAAVVLAQINSRVPRTHGDGLIPIEKISAAWIQNAELTTSAPHPSRETDLAIAHHIASLIEDGSTLQMGIGAIPDAVLSQLHHFRHLGVHTEMFSDGLLPLLRSGAVDNSRKVLNPGKTATSFVMGSTALYDFVHDNPSVLFLQSDEINQAALIARQPKMVAINSAVEVDLTGQVVSDSIGHRIISGVGGQMDFIRGASLSEGGKPIIALPSRTQSGRSRITATLQSGAGVVTTRAHVHFVVTEYGIADLFGRTLGERARALVQIAHPGDRERLWSEWKQTSGLGI